MHLTYVTKGEEEREKKEEKTNKIIQKHKLLSHDFNEILSLTL